MSAEAKITAILSKAGITVGGKGPIDVRVADAHVFSRVLGGGTLTIGEAFMNKEWDVDDLAGLLYTVYKSRLYSELVAFDSWSLLLRGLFTNLQSRSRAFMVGVEHYDLGTDLYTAMLDARMVYTSAIWDGVDTLEAAQEQKLERMCQKVDLRPGQHVLDIGCGWGSFMKYAAEKHNASAVGLTVSVGQTAHARTLCVGLPVEFVISDYRDYLPAEKFDHVVSIEMIEAVGPRNLRAYFKKARSVLKDSGRFGLQAIMGLEPKPAPDAWLDKYIFPNGILPSLAQIEKATRGLFMIESLENFAADYDRTLMEWWRRFDAAYPKLQASNPQYNERFYRMWKFYLQGCAGLFRADEAQVCQIILRPV